MRTRGIGRRTFLREGSLIALGAAGFISSQETHAQSAVPNSAGTTAPRLKAPQNACDCHHHIYDAVRFPQPPQATAPLLPNARVEEYRLLQRRLQTMRSVVVTPSAYATDNRVTLDAIAQFGARARGVAVVRPDVTDAELKTLANGGIRGIRFSLTTPSTAATTIDMIEPLSKRVAALGWHVQINMTADQIADADALWNRLPSPIVFDHIGHISGPEGTRHPAYTVMRRLIDKGRTWVKLSVTYDNTTDGPPGYGDVVTLGQSLVKAAPQRLVWGSNWPHPNEPRKPDDALLFDLMMRWAPDEATRHRILVENAGILYDFGNG
jgi:D-galactarolactone isomerase